MSITEFLDYVFDGSDPGYFSLTLFKHGLPQNERFIEWPKQRNLLTDDGLKSTAQGGDLYFTPALFSEPCRRADRAIGSHVAWVDLDESSPGPSTCPPAGLRVASGTAGHEHAYWRAERFLEPWEVERWNDKLASILHADHSGWDIAQLLRLPGTLNWKTNPPRPVIHLNGSSGIFPVPELHRLIVPKLQLPTTVLPLKELDDYTKELCDSTPVDRSKTLWHIGCRLVERDWSIQDVKTLLASVDVKWGKFKGRPEQLDELVTRLFERRSKFTVTDFDSDTLTTDEVVDEPETKRDLRSTPRGFLTLKRTATPIEWVIPGLLRKRGLLYLAGPTGVGKSTFACNLGAALALQKSEWAGFEITPGCKQKILYGSHEMDESEVMFFLEPMFDGLAPYMLDQLEERLHIVTYGQSIPLDEPKYQKAYEKLIVDGNYTGFIIDTLGASTSTSLQDEGNTRKIADWLDKIRQKYGVWVTVLAHPRKAPAGVKNHQYTLDDMYGSRIFGDRANTVLFMQPTKHRDAVELRAEKTRFSGGTKHRFLKRNELHWFAVAENYTSSTATVATVTDLSDAEVYSLHGEEQNDDVD